jgi:tetratricopeptide (TPR) repeat protein
VTDQIEAWTAELSADADSMVFLPLGEALRRRGLLDGALAVARGGVQRYPDLAEGHDLLARILSDRGEGDGAFDAWTTALRLAPEMVGPRKGLGFLCYRMGDFVRALRQLESAATLAPGDPTISVAIARVRARIEEQQSEPTDDPFAVAEGWQGTTMLLDTRGRRLMGNLQTPDGQDCSDAVAAGLAGVSREATRAATLLDLGYWHAIQVEGLSARLVLTEPTNDTLLLLQRPADTPAGRLPLIADRAGAMARRWLERMA